MNKTFTFDCNPLDNIDLVDIELNKIEELMEVGGEMELREPSSECIQRILAFSKAYHVQKTKNIDLEMILN